LKKLITTFLILPVLCLILFACGGSAIGDAQEFSPNEAPSILSIKVVNFDGSEITQLDIEPYKQFKLIIEAVDPDNNPLEYKFDSASGTFAGILSNAKGCEAVFKTGSIRGGQNIELWAGVSDGNGALVRQSYNLGTGKSGPAITAKLEKIHFRPTESVKLSISANCSGFFQLYCNGNSEEKFDFEKDMYRYSYSENKTTDFILAGPNCTSYADIVLESKAQYDNDTSYNLVLVFRDGLFQTCDYGQTIYVDGTPPEIKEKDGFSFVENAELAPEVTVIFNEEIGYADSSCLKLEPAGGNVKLLRISGKTVYFSVTGLESLTPYRATISGIKDIAGNMMVPDSKNSFMTKYSGSSKFVVYDKSAGMSFTSYRGFENKTLTLTSNQGEDFTCVSSDSDIVSVENKILTVKTHDYALTDKSLSTDRTITITATNGNGEKAYFVITIKPWYPVTKASEFGQGEIIDQNLNGRFRLENNIDFKASNVSAISPIGCYIDGFPETPTNKPFTGIFDGYNKTLSNFKINPASSDRGNAGIFAYNKGTITNLKVNSATFEVSSKGTVGIICAVNEGTISNCDLENINITAFSYAGGIAGYNYDLISNCKVLNDSVVNASDGVAGGLVGKMISGKIEKSSSNCNVEGGGVLGGLIGYYENGAVINCNSNAEVSGDNAVGGFVGSWQNGSIEGDCYSKGTVSGKVMVGGFAGAIKHGFSVNGLYSESVVYALSGATACFGGFAGCVEGYGSITNCYSTGSVNASGCDDVGGLIGYVEDSYDKAGVTITLSRYDNKDGGVTGKANVGGLIGRIAESVTSDVNIDQCFANTTIVTGSSNNIGGLIGYLNSAEITDCYSRGRVEGSENIGGLIGYVNDEKSTVSYCYSIATVFSKNSKNYGELIGSVNSAVFNILSVVGSYYLDVAVDSKNGGEGKSIDQLKDKDIYIDWTICDIDTLETAWWIDSKASDAVNSGFPYLREIPPK